MQSETLESLLESFSSVRNRLETLGQEAQRLSEMRTELRIVATGLGQLCREMDGVTASLSAGAAVMRDLDMASTLRRLNEIQAALESRMTGDFERLGTVLTKQVTVQLETLPAQLAPAVASAFSEQAEVTRKVIERSAATADQHHRELLGSLKLGLEVVVRDNRERIVAASGELSGLVRNVDSQISAKVEAATESIDRWGRANRKLIAIAVIFGGIASIVSIIQLFR